MADKKSTKNKSLARGQTTEMRAGRRTAGKQGAVRALPKSKAKNAYDLLSDVARIVLEEPRRLHMNFWKLTNDRSLVPRRGFPKCGTVACIGGWIEVLKPAVSAYSTLGLDRYAASNLFYPPSLLSTAGDLDNGEGQTMKHARAVVAHIRRFQREHAAQLKAKSVIA